MPRQQQKTAPSKQIIGIISDSHDHLDNIDRALALFHHRRTDLIIHAGDFVSPFALKKFKDLWCPFVGIFGNNEGEKVGLKSLLGPNAVLQDPPLQYRFQEYLFFITHIPFDFQALADSGLYTAIIYGHTHHPEVIPGKTLIINPGESCGWVEGRPTVAILTLPERQVEILDLTRG